MPRLFELNIFPRLLNFQTLDLPFYSRLFKILQIIFKQFVLDASVHLLGMARLRGYWKSSSDSENSEGDGEVSAAGNERAGKVSAVGNELNEIQEVAG